MTRPKDTPMAVGLKLEDFDVNTLDVDEPFGPKVDHLMWLARNTRPDILSATRAIARYSHAPCGQ